MSSLSSITQQSTRYPASLSEATQQADPTVGSSGSFGFRAFRKISGSDTSDASSSGEIPSPRGLKRPIMALSQNLGATYHKIYPSQSRTTETGAARADTVPARFQISTQSQTGANKVYDIKLHKLIGTGANGAVFKASASTGAPESERMYALKVSKIFADDPQATRRSQDGLLREAKILNIWNQINPEGELSLAQMWCGPFRVGPDRIGCLQALYGSSVLDYLKNEKLRNIFSLKIVRAAACELLEALDALETAGIIHADIKPENIVVNQQGNKFYIIDAGNNAMCPRGKHRANETQEYVVSRWYRPPEVVFHKPYGHAADRWSLMCVLFEMHTGQPLFPAPDTPTLKNMFVCLLGPAPRGYITDESTRLRPTVDLAFSKKAQFSDPLDSQIVFKSENPEEEEAFKALLEANLTWEEERRLTADEMNQHPFFATFIESVEGAAEATREA
ncbi:MAG: serine/threonine-protein kinase [Chlamydiia bacterium]|nr:serine/threonine-protein kinase [Chlamydiia bacterium]